MTRVNIGKTVPFSCLIHIFQESNMNNSPQHNDPIEINTEFIVDLGQGHDFMRNTIDYTPDRFPHFPHQQFQDLPQLNKKLQYQRTFGNSCCFTEKNFELTRKLDLGFYQHSTGILESKLARVNLTSDPLTPT